MGFGLSKYYIDRKKFFSEFELFVSNISSNIIFGREKMLTIITKYNTQHKSADMAKLCDNYSEILSKKDIISDNLFQGITILKSEEKKLFLNFFSNLGKYDAISQSNEIKSYSTKFNELYIQSAEDCKKYASLFIKLAVIVGLLVCLLII